MASKEATVYIVSVGQPMGAKRHGRNVTDLEWALEYVWDKITTTVATGRKTALLSVVGVGTDSTSLGGVMEDEEGYENISVFSEIKQYLLDDIRHLQRHLKVNKTNEGDLLSAVAIAVQMIDSATQGKNGNPLKFDRRIVIVTDGRGELETGDLSQIAAKVKDPQAPIQLILLGVDFDDVDEGYKEENKDSRKAANERTLKSFVEDCDGTFGTLATAIDQLQLPRLKEVRPIPNFKGQLTLGDTANYEATITIDVERYPCTMIAKAPTASSFTIRTDGASTFDGDPGPSETVVGEDHPMTDLSVVRNQRVYQISKPDEPGTKTNVEMDELERGFEYGRTAVHISESDMNVVKLETETSLSIVGFIAAEKFDRFLAMGRTNFIVAQKANQAAQLGLSAFIHALYEGDCYAVARLVTKDLKPPVLILLVPRIEPDFEALVDVELPFEEDMRGYKFPPLDRKVTVSGKTIKEHRDLPSKNLEAAMSDYVDAMDLSTFGQDDGGQPDEYAKFEDTFSPLVHRINTIIRWRATHPDAHTPLPDPPPILTKYANPPDNLLTRTSQHLEMLKAAANVKKVPPKVKGRGKRARAHREKPLSGLDVDGLLGHAKQPTVDPANLVPSFKQALAATDDLAAIQATADAMATQIRSLIRDSVGDSGYGRALEALRVMKEELTELEEPEIWNAFVRNLRNEILGGKLGGERREMWWRIKGSRYGLVDRKRSLVSAVSEEEAAEFYKS